MKIISFFVILIMMTGCFLNVNYCEDGLLNDGKHIDYHHKTHNKRIYYIKDCLKNGIYEEYYKNNILKTKGYYNQGQRIGKWLCINPKGDTICDQYYKDGILDFIEARNTVNKAIFFYEEKIILLNKDSIFINKEAIYKIASHSSYMIQVENKDSILIYSDEGNFMIGRAGSE